MTAWLRQSTSVVVHLGPFVDKTDGVTLEAGLATAMDNATTGIRVAKAGAAFIDRNSATAPAYDARGDYRITLSTTDTNTLGALRIIYEDAATCLPVWRDFMVVPSAVYDSTFNTTLRAVNVTQVGGTAQTAGNLKLDLNIIKGYQGPNGLGVYFDDASGASGTTLGTHGTLLNPVNSAANALTLAVALGARRIYIMNDSTYTISGALDGYEIIGLGGNNLIALAGVVSTGTRLVNLTASGDAGTSGYIYDQCELGAITLFNGTARNCVIAGALTMTDAEDAIFDSCSAKHGTTPILNFASGPGGGSLVTFANYSNGLDVRSMDTTGDTLQLAGNGHLIIAASCTVGDIHIRGNFSVSGAGGGVTITQAANSNTTNLATPTNITSGTITTVTNLTNAPTNGDLTATMKTSVTTAATAATPVAASVTGAVGSVTAETTADVTKISGSATAADNLEASALGIIPGVAVTGTLSTTVMTSDLSGYLDDELIGRVVVWTSGTATGQASTITDYASTSGTVTYDVITTAPLNNDTFVIV